MSKSTIVHKLKSGIIINDNRQISCGIYIQNIDTKYMELSYSSKFGFFINIKSCWLRIEEYEQFHKELEIMRLSLIEAKHLELEK